MQPYRAYLSLIISSRTSNPQSQKRHPEFVISILSSYASVPPASTITMGRTLQKAKKRSSIPRATLKPKSLKRPVRSSPLVAAHWDKHLTLSQNYRNLGLANKLNARSGGIEIETKDIGDIEKGQKRDPLAIAGGKGGVEKGLKTAKVVRDESGKIVKVLHEKVHRNPLNDPLVALEGETDVEGSRSGQVRSDHDRDGGVVLALEDAAIAELRTIKGKRKPRKQSEREVEWIEALVAKYGDDVRAMSRDWRLNPNQQMEKDIGRRIRVWRESKRGDDVEG